MAQANVDWTTASASKLLELWGTPSHLEKINTFKEIKCISFQNNKGVKIYLFALFFETVLSNPGWFQNLCQTPEC